MDIRLSRFPQKIHFLIILGLSISFAGMTQESLGADSTCVLRIIVQDLLVTPKTIDCWSLNQKLVIVGKVQNQFDTASNLGEVELLINRVQWSSWRNSGTHVYKVVAKPYQSVFKSKLSDFFTGRAYSQVGSLNSKRPLYEVLTAEMLY